MLNRTFVVITTANLKREYMLLCVLHPSKTAARFLCAFNPNKIAVYTPSNADQNRVYLAPCGGLRTPLRIPKKGARSPFIILPVPCCIKP